MKPFPQRHNRSSPFPFCPSTRLISRDRASCTTSLCSVNMGVSHIMCCIPFTSASHRVVHPHQELFGTAVSGYEQWQKSPQLCRLPATGQDFTLGIEFKLPWNVWEEELRQGKKVLREERKRLFYTWAANWVSSLGENWAKLVSLNWSRKFQGSHISPFRCTGPGPAGCLLEATYMESIQGTTWTPPAFKYRSAPDISIMVSPQERHGPKKDTFSNINKLSGRNNLGYFVNSLRGGYSIEHTVWSTNSTWRCVRHRPSSVISCSPCPGEKSNSDAKLHASWITTITGWQNSIEKKFSPLDSENQRCFWWEFI